MIRSIPFFFKDLKVTWKILGVFIESEVNVSDGRADAFVQTPTHIYCLEFKLNKSAETGLKQISQKGYLDKLESDKQKVAIGINFETEARKINDWKATALAK